jgi:pimeloyl-ACP methyl ester carboxylesterase
MRADYAVAYVATVIESPEDRDIVIALAVDDNMKIWLNHELLAADPDDALQWIKKYQHLMGARLKKGSNFLVVKVRNLTKDWRLIVNLYPRESALRLARENGVNPILASSVVAAGHPLEFRRDLLPAATFDRIEVLDARRAPVKFEPGKVEANRLYYCRATVEGETVERPFYYGDLDAGYQRLSKQAARFYAADASVAIDLKAQLARLQHLLKPASRLSEFWDRKVAALFAELEDGLAALGTSVKAFRQAPGTHIRGYVSTVDDQVQHYWVHVPEKALSGGKPLPIVIVLPFITTANEPFLESFYLAAFDENERNRILGDEYGFAVLRMWGRGNYLAGTAIATADVLEALAAVERDYPIDKDRIYLSGDCEAGRLALLLAERYPDRFAAVATEAPITVLRKLPMFLEPWAEFASPVAAVGNLVNTPVYIRHDEADTPPIEESVEFVSRCQKAGVDATLVRVQDGYHGYWQDPMGERRAMFEFFRGKRRPAARQLVPPALPFRILPGRGPIEEAFGGPVLVVQGTGGAADQRAAVQTVVEGLRREWKKAYFVECPVKRDVEVSEADIAQHNLILVGDKATNSVIGRMADRLPLSAAADRVTLAEKTWKGQRLGYQFIVYNPLNPSRYVVVTGMNSWAARTEWKLHPSRHGLCDYFV